MSKTELLQSASIIHISHLVRSAYL